MERISSASSIVMISPRSQPDLGGEKMFVDALPVLGFHHLRIKLTDAALSIPSSSES
jgi:hypothetical protein